VKRIFAFALVAVLALVAGGLASSDHASAHEVRGVGNYQFVVGFLNEPAFAYEQSGLDLRVSFFPNGAPQGGGEESEGQGQPVEGLEDTLKAEVIAGGAAAKQELPIEAAFGDPGAYESPMIFTVPGDYSFHIFGDIQGQKIDETFDSGPETFGPMENPQDIQFPQTLAAPATSNEASNSSNDGGSDDTARALGIIGIIVGVIGVAVAGVTLARRRS
jgi:hypothetical protein